MTRIDLDAFDPSGDVRTIADEAGALPGTTRRGLVKRSAAGVGTFAAGSALLGLLDPFEAMAVASGAQKGAYSTKLSKVDRTSKGPTANDVVIGNYALTLEYIEAAFYAAADSMGYDDKDIAAAAKVLAAHEQAHVDLLKKVLGKAAVKTPKFNMDAVAALLKDEETFITTAAGIEPVGTAAYAGAGPYLSNIDVTKAALSIHSVEANHAAYTAQICAQKGFKAPSPVEKAFNVPFTFGKTIKTVSGLGVVKGDLQP